MFLLRCVLRHFVLGGPFWSAFRDHLWQVYSVHIKSVWDVSFFPSVSLHHTTAYHPQSNRMVQHFRCSLKSSLYARLTDLNWYYQLPWVLLVLRTNPKEGLGFSPAALAYHHSPLLACSIVSPPPVSFPTMVRHQCSPASPAGLKLSGAAHVLVCVDGHYLLHHLLDQHPYKGPFHLILLARRLQQLTCMVP